MERLQALINMLQEQVSRRADPGQMQITLRMMQAELNQMQSNGTKVLGTSKVAVVLPSSPGNFSSAGREQAVEIKEPAQDHATHSKSKSKPAGQLDLHFDPLTEIPTLSHQQRAREINEITTGDEKSLNDKLKEEKTEVMHVLKDAPIRDLRKAIGINDRFTFIAELFRGDESMYERSLKTINSFNIYAEAEYWMNRELKVKLGWNDTTETFKHFYQLVKRRFS